MGQEVNMKVVCHPCSEKEFAAAIMRGQQPAPVHMEPMYTAKDDQGIQTVTLYCPVCRGQAAVQTEGAQKNADGALQGIRPEHDQLEIERDLTPDHLKGTNGAYQVGREQLAGQFDPNNLGLDKIQGAYQVGRE